MRLEHLDLAVAASLAGSCSGSLDPLPLKTIEQLVDTKEPRMAQVREWISGAANTVELMDADPIAGRRARAGDFRSGSHG